MTETKRLGLIFGISPCEYRNTPFRWLSTRGPHCGSGTAIRQFPLHIYTFKLSLEQTPQRAKTLRPAKQTYLVVELIYINLWQLISDIGINETSFLPMMADRCCCYGSCLNTFHPLFHNLSITGCHLYHIYSYRGIMIEDMSFTCANYLKKPRCLHTKPVHLHSPGLWSCLFSKETMNLKHLAYGYIAARIVYHGM